MDQGEPPWDVCGSPPAGVSRRVWLGLQGWAERGKLVHTGLSWQPASVKSYCTDLRAAHFNQCLVVRLGLLALLCEISAIQH